MGGGVAPPRIQRSKLSSSPWLLPPFSWQVTRIPMLGASIDSPGRIQASSVRSHGRLCHRQMTVAKGAGLVRGADGLGPGLVDVELALGVGVDDDHRGRLAVAVL